VSLRRSYLVAVALRHALAFGCHGFGTPNPYRGSERSTGSEYRTCGTRKLCCNLPLSVYVLSAVLAMFPLPLAADGPRPDLKNQVDRLVDQLASSDASKRATATAHLLRLGTDILPYLPGADAKLPGEQKKQIDEIRKTLLDALARKELTPRRCTIRDRTISLKAALEQLTKQTGIQVDERTEEKGGSQTLKLDIQNATFWQALDTIAKEADLRVSFFQKDSTIALTDGPYKETPISYDGLFRTTVNRLDLGQDYRTDMHTLVVQLQIAWEPRFQPIFLESPFDELTARDGKDHVLTIPESGKGRFPVGRPLVVDVPLRIEAPRRSAEKLSELKGTISVLGSSKPLSFTFDKIADKPSNRKETQEGVTVTLREFQAEPERWAVGIALDYPPETPDFESFESWLVNNEIFLQKADGKTKISANGGYEIMEQSGHRAVMIYRFIEDEKVTLGKPSDWKLVYRTAGAIIRLPVHFEFRDLPLP
jgi:hypothetical protein